MALNNILDPLYLPLSVLCFSGGGLYLKRFADGGPASDLWIALTVYLLGDLLLIGVLQKGLGYAMTVSSCLQMVFMCGAGIVLFGESLSPAKMAGLACALLAVALFSLPSPNGVADS